MHARVENGQIVSFGLPESARRLDTGEWVMGLRTAPAELVKATGHLPVTEQRAALGANQTYGDPTYTVRADDVLADFPAVALPASTINEQTIRSQIGTGLSALQAIIDTAQPTVNSTAAAQTAIRALQAQVKDMARIQRKMLRLLDDRLDGTD